MLRTAARSWLEERFPATRLATLADTEPGWDPTSWKEIANLGWTGLSVDEAHGGAGMDFLAEAVVFEETGRSIYPGPLLSTVASSLPLLDDAQIAAVVAGDLRATAALYSAPITVDGDGRLTGDVRYLPDLAIVDIAILPAGDGWFAVDLREHAGLVTPLATTDRTRRLGHLTLTNTPAQRLAATAADADQARLRTQAALALEAVGIAARSLAVATEQAGQRQQFGRIIGTYQAVSHQVSDMYVRVELARSLAYWAAWSVSTGDPGVHAAVGAAKSAAGEAAVRSAEQAIQVMGGIGFTWDHLMHRYYKRAQAINGSAGTARVHRAALAAHLLD